jgi:hypothetical protein
MAAKKGKKTIKVQDLKPKKDAKGGNPVGHNPVGHNPVGHNPVGRNPVPHSPTGN